MKIHATTRNQFTKSLKCKGSLTSRGFSLIEILIALVIVSTGLIAVAQFQGISLKETNMSQQRIQAVTFGEEQLEELRATVVDGTTFSSLAAANDTDGGDTGGGNEGNTTFTRSWTVSSTPSGSKQVNMAVSWQDRENKTQIVNLSTVISKTTTRDVGVALVALNDPTPAVQPIIEPPAEPPPEDPPADPPPEDPPADPPPEDPPADPPPEDPPAEDPPPDPDTIEVDTIACSCGSGSNSSSTGYYSGSSLNSICETCCSLSSGGGGMGGGGMGGGMGKPSVSGKISTQGGGGGMMGGGSTPQSCTVYKSGRCEKK